MGRTALSEDTLLTLLRQFLFEVVQAAINLQALSCSIYYEDPWKIDCGAVALSFPQLARLRALELTEEGDAQFCRCFLAVYIAL